MCERISKRISLKADKASEVSVFFHFTTAFACAKTCGPKALTAHSDCLEHEMNGAQKCMSTPLKCLPSCIHRGEFIPKA
ncbi:hypothetical protein BaRGS_00039856 [Batillaria attramentaria]|uniref:Uncharacterized protein n=1 Tax=Batillaria attramentaria TaxID=370345 RepID=A0ABD0J1X8_9CAEN